MDKIIKRIISEHMIVNKLRRETDHDLAIESIWVIEVKAIHKPEGGSRSRGNKTTIKLMPE